MVFEELNLLIMSRLQTLMQLNDGNFKFSLLSTSSGNPPAFSSHDEKLTNQPSPSPANKISPEILVVLVIVAAIFFISGLVHFFFKFLVKNRPSPTEAGSGSNTYPEVSDSEAFQRQLQQLFHLHDSGLDQAFIDSFPVFLYGDLLGSKEPFDCAVCLCEFSQNDKLRLLPLCSHAFHIGCIDTWLLSNSTCPLCRESLYMYEFPCEFPVFNFERQRGTDRWESGEADGGRESNIANQKRVFSVRLGKFRNANERAGVERPREAGGSSSTSNSSNLDPRRCYSMGSYQYMVAESDLKVAMCAERSDRFGKNGNDGHAEGKKINHRSKGDSFSISKIWQWSNKGNVSHLSETQAASPSVTIASPRRVRMQAS